MKEKEEIKYVAKFLTLTTIDITSIIDFLKLNLPVVICSRERTRNK